MLTRSFFAGLFSAGLLAATLPAAAIEAIPESCLKCKSIADDGRFVMCLYDCLGSVKLDSYQKDKSVRPSTRPDRPNRSEREESPRLNENDSATPSIAGWSTKEMRQADGSVGRVAMTNSEDVFPFFFERVEPTLIIMKEEKDEAQIVIDVRPAAATGFSDRILLQVDNEKIRSYPLKTVWDGHAAVIRDKSLLEALRDGRELRVRMDIFGAGTQTFGFQLKGSAKILRWLDEAHARRS